MKMSDPDQRGLDVARQVAQWYLGSSWWADHLIKAYLNPDQAEERLRNEKAAVPS